jgi:hypothetical protein
MIVTIKTLKFSMTKLNPSKLKHPSFHLYTAEITINYKNPARKPGLSCEERQSIDLPQPPQIYDLMKAIN